LKPMLSFLFAFLMVSGTAFSDEGISDPTSADTDFGQWESEFKSSLDSIGDSAQEEPSASSPLRPQPLPLLTTADAKAAKDLPGSGDGSRVDRLENTVAQLERAVKALEDRQRILDRTVDDLKRRR